MAFLTEAKLKLMYDVDRITDLASRESPSLGGRFYDATVITTLIDQAEVLIKGALSKNYTVAEIEADTSLQRMCGDLTMYYLEVGRGQVPAGLKQLYEIHLTRLDALISGDEKLSAVAELLPTVTIVAPLSENLYSEDEYFETLVGDDEVI